MATSSNIWVFSEKPALLPELVAAGCSMASSTNGKVTALVLGSRDESEKILTLGADDVFWLGELKPGYIADDYVPTLLKLLNEQKPSIFLIGSTRQGKAIAGRLAARMRVTGITDLLRFSWEGEKYQATHMVFGGGAVRTEHPLQEPIIATIGPGIFDPLPVTASNNAEIKEVTFVEPPWRAIIREYKALPKASVSLSAARKVVTAGRGIAKQEDLTMIEELARSLGAEIACTRPLAEGLDWLPRERYIGISGAVIKPDLYFGVGVSGQVQHMIGMNRSRVVAAINKDPNAPIFNYADYGIVADLYTVIPALIKTLQSRK